MHIGRGGGVRGGGNGSSGDGTGRGNGRSPEDDGVCRLAASLMQHDAILMLMRRTYASAGGLENWEEVPETIHAFRVIAIVEEILQNRIEA